MRSTLQQMRSSARQLIAVALAITISVGFVATVLQVGGVIERSAWNAVAAQYNGADAIVTSPSDVPMTASTVNAVRGVSGVATAEGRQLTNASVSSGSREVYPIVAAVPVAPALRNALVLSSGRLPEASGEVILLADLAQQLKVTPGATATLDPFSNGESLPITIVGIVDAATQFGGTNAPQLYAWPDDLRAWAMDEEFSSILVTANAETDPRTMIARIQDALSGDYVVRTRDQQAEAMMLDVTDGTDLLTIGLLGFAIVALFVAGLVISNTFAILVAQRTRQLALLRCVGATRSQIRRGVMSEAIALSVIASLVGIVVGIAVIQIGVRLVDRIWPGLGVANNPSYGNAVLLAPFILGILATTAAAWGPARRATLVAPLAALRPAAPDVFRSPVTFRRLLITLALLGTGGLIMLGGIMLSLDNPGWGPILISIFGGMISFLGVLVGAVVVVPRVVSLMGNSLARIGGAPAQIAASNSSRNPRRTTATAAALLIAVTLVTMMSVGAESAKSTLNREIDERSPIDLIIGTESVPSTVDPDQWVYPPLSANVGAVLSGNSAIEAVAPVLQTTGQIDDIGVDLLGIAPDQFLQVTRSQNAFDEFADGTALFDSDLAFNIGLADGDIVEITVGSRRLPVTVRAANLPSYAILLTGSDIKQLAPTITTPQVWARLTDDADHGETISSIQDALGGATGLWYSGGAEERASNNDVLDTLLWIVTALLGVAIVISLVGVSNTLSLSVLERTRESAVLRAIGLTKRQLRVMLALEGVLLALVGAVIGIVLGTVYGFAGALALIGGTWSVSFSAPVGRIVVIVLIAIAAGILASVLPARNALKTSPVAALAG